MSAGRLGQLSALVVAAAFGYMVGLAGSEGAPELRAEAAATTETPTAAGAGAMPARALQSADDRVFELRTYTAAEGKYEALLARFRDDTMRIFEKHGMENVGYWTPQDGPENTLIYLISHASREQADANWQAFIADPEWQQVAEESQRDGRIISGLERMWLEPTDYSPIK